MTPQEIFDTAARAMLKQGRPSVRAFPLGNFCAYLSPNGSRCAVGWLMNDEEIKAFGDFQGGVCGLVESTESRARLRPFFFEHEDLLSSIQGAHDMKATVFDPVAGMNVVNPNADDWRLGFIKEMQAVAILYDLDPAVLKEVP
jgi:hypothetical protein